MYRANERVQVPQDILRSIYDKCFRLVIYEMLPGHIAHWPPSYDAALLQYRWTTNDRLALGSVDIPWEIFLEFSERLLEKIRPLNRMCSDAYNMHEVRGSKEKPSITLDHLTSPEWL